MSTVPSSRQTTFLGHPIGLYFLFFTEMWERFSYYGMRALLMLYMVNHFKWTTSGSASIYKWYTTLVYVTPIIGGLLADRVLAGQATLEEVKAGMGPRDPHYDVYLEDHVVLGGQGIVADRDIETLGAATVIELMTGQGYAPLFI